jgi:sarcosine oxidase gamma subunit
MLVKRRLPIAKPRAADLHGALAAAEPFAHEQGNQATRAAVGWTGPGGWTIL